MARKDRAPTPPKRPQGPQRRSTPTSPEDAAKRRRLIMILVASGLVALAVSLSVVFLRGGGGDGGDIVATLEDAGCEVQAVPAQPGAHSAEETATDDPQWNTDPPSSGPHYQVPAVYGEYDTPLRIAQVVHNLEHGGMFILYGPDLPAATREQLLAFYDDDPRGLLLAPYAKLGDEIALGAWTTPDDDPESGGTAYLAKCTTYDEGAFKAFRDELRFRGPERFPPESLQPGST